MPTFCNLRIRVVDVALFCLFLLTIVFKDTIVMEKIDFGLAVFHPSGSNLSGSNLNGSNLSGTNLIGSKASSIDVVVSNVVVYFP